MATTRLMPLHTGKGRTVGQAISDIIDYTENPQKTDGGRLITSWQCDSRIADAEFLFTKNQYIQKTGRVRGEDDVIAYHLRQSFVPGEITPEDANRLGCELAKRFTKGNHAYIVCTHIDKVHIHNHVIWNSTALSQTRKFRNFWGSSRAVRRLNDTICIENGYSIVENPKRHGKSYNKWLGDKMKPSHRERICTAIDDALTQKPDSFETLLELLRQAGYEVKGKKVPSLLGGEQKKSIRMDTLGDGYTPADLRAVIAGEKAHTPRKSAAAPVKPEKRSGNLLVDIQTKLRAGKGAGYARWATLFNLKQMAQTVAYLQDHELLDYAVLSEKAAAASAHFNELSARIKASETRMAEIAVLREHIVGYAKTRDTYVAYPDNYAMLTTDAALRSELIACRMRHLLYGSTATRKETYLASAGVVQGIRIKAQENMLEITLPCLLPKRKQRQSTEFLIDPLYFTLSQYSENNELPKFRQCVVCFSHIYSEKFHNRRVRDYDNLELKQLLDVLSTFIMVDDTGLLVDAYNTTEIGEADCTRISVMAKEDFPKWLNEREKSLKTISDF